VQSIPESATLGEASVQFVAAVADLKARVLQEQEVIDGEPVARIAGGPGRFPPQDGEATTRPTPPFLAVFGGCPSKVCKRTVPTGSRFADILGLSRG